MQPRYRALFIITKMNRKGQTALEYMLMVAVVLMLLVLVITMVGYVENIGTGLGGTIDNTRGQVIDWIMT